MRKSKKSLVNTPRPYLSYSQMILWERDKEQYRRRYFDGIQQPTNQYLETGKKLADRLETGIESGDEFIEYLALFMPKYPATEFEIQAEWDGISILGRLDGFSNKGKIIGEYKTGKCWNQNMVDKSDQLTFYSALVWLKYGRLPSKIFLHWAKTEIDEFGILRINGEIRTFETTRTLSDIILLRGRIVKCWTGIKEMSKKYNYAERI